MEDKFNIRKWRNDLSLRDNKLTENVNPIELKRKLEDIFIKLFPSAKYITVYLPSEDSRVRGKITVGVKEDISKEDLYYINLELDKLDLKLDQETTSLYYDVEPGESISYPVIYFTYL